MDPSQSETQQSSSKRPTRRERRLHMLNCNDIMSPPLWVLPLVHSPQYLAHLWELAEEAKQVLATRHLIVMSWLLMKCSAIFVASNFNVVSVFPRFNITCLLYGSWPDLSCPNYLSDCLSVLREICTFLSSSTRSGTLQVTPLEGATTSQSALRRSRFRGRNKHMS
jgi:hypothetical protein